MRQFFLLGSRSRKFNENMCAAVGRIGDLQRSAVRFDDGLNDGEAEAGTAVLRGEERICGLQEGIVIEARACVSEADESAARIALAAGNEDFSRSIHSLLGVGKDIIECAVEQIHIAKHRKVFRQSIFDLDFRALELSAEESHGFVYDMVQAHIVAAGLTRSGIVEEVVDSRSEPAGFVINGREHGLRHGIFTFMTAYQEF